MRPVVALAVVLSLAALASAAVTDRNVQSPGRVEALARSGYSVAFGAAPTRVEECHQVALWSLVTRGVTRFGKRAPCEETSTGSGLAGLAVAGNRLLWLEFAGGNLRDWLLYTATTTARRPRMLRFVERDVDAVQPIRVGVASESVLPYSVDRTVIVLRANGSRLYRWQAPARVTNMTSYGSRVAVFVEGGRCFLLTPSGTVQRVYTFPRGAVQEFALGGIGLLVQLTGRRVQILRNGAVVRQLTVPLGARMRDFAEGILLYSLGGQIRGRKVRTGRDVLLRRAGLQAPLAQLEHNGLSYTVGRRVFSVAMVNVQAAFR
jgi:hypothetical protein